MSTTAQDQPTALIGAAIVRREDERFLRGAGRYTDDIQPPEAAYAVAVRSPLPHARITGIDTTTAVQTPGVLAVLCAADLDNEIACSIPSLTSTPPFDIRNVDGQLMPDGSQPIIAKDTVRYAGEIVAFVVADTLAAARDGAERVEVDYHALPSAMTFDGAQAADAAQLWDDAPGNRSLDWAKGDRRTVAQVFEQAAHTVRCELHNNRIAPCFMEPRAAVAYYDSNTGHFTLEAGCQGVHPLKAGLCNVLGLEAEKLRVVAPDTGGGFGARNNVYPELALSLLAARRLKRPVKWTADRTESFLTDFQARDQVLEGELALDKNGRFLALRAVMKWRHGGYLVGRNVYVMVAFLPPTLGGVYQIPHVHISMRGAFTNTTPQAAFRGIGRVESNFLIERLIDTAARVTGIDPIALRRRNLVAPEQLPWTTAGGAVITSGEFEHNLDRALNLAEHDRFEQRQAEAAARGKLRGFGVGLFVENDGGAPSEFAEVEIEPQGRVTVYVGTQDFGMGHSTIYAQIAAQYLDVAYDAIDVVFGDTSKVKLGSGSHGSRSARIGGTAVVMGAEKVLEKARALASDRLEAAPADITYAAGHFTIDGTDRSVSMFELAEAAQGNGGRLADEAEFMTQVEAHSNGCHISEVEVDAETGAISIVQHVMVLDVGRAINPLIVHGQLHGGAAQGLGQAALGSSRIRFRQRPDLERQLHGLHHSARRRSAHV